jgi:DNA-binding transcriptional MerR regulator
VDYRISEVAARTGFSATTLRYYEDIGLVVPAGRTGAGYRVYDDASLERLAFVARAKRLGLSLEDVRSLVTLLDEEECAPVQRHLTELVGAKLAETRTRIAELLALAAQLQAMADRLAGAPPHAGPCGDDCSCAIDAGAGEPVAVRIGRSDDPAVVCTLEPAAMPGRVEDWQRLLATASGREPIDGGVRVRFPATDPAFAAEVAALAAAEQGCCAFYRFAVVIDGDGSICLDVRSPDSAAAVTAALFGQGYYG